MRMGLSKRMIIPLKYKHITYKLYFYIIFLTTTLVCNFVVFRLEVAFMNAFTPYAINFGSDAINYTVANYFAENEYSYSDFVKLSYDNDNSITSLQTNSSLMNSLKSQLSINIQEELDNIKENSLSVPLGNVSDNIIFHGIGPMIDISVNSAEVTDLVFNDTFDSVGINQVRHKIYVDVFVTVSISCANITQSEVIHDTIPVTETVIVGKVPKYFSENTGMNVLADNKED